MISSTSLDLPEHPWQVIEGCKRADFDTSEMEPLPARHADAAKVSLKLVDEADVYIGIYAHRCGSGPDGSVTSPCTRNRPCR
jgi:hypothetical protein